MKTALLTAIGIAIYAEPLANSDFLEPSVRGEVDHALDIAPTNLVASAKTGCWFKTNNLSRSEIAIKIVSLQKSDGRWLDGTNDVTAAAVEILRSL